MTILFLEVIAPWLEGPAKGLGGEVPVTALQHVDYRAQRRLGLDSIRREGGLTYRTRVFPPGFAGALSPLFAPLIRAGVNRAFARMKSSRNIRPHVIAPFPYAAPWVRDVPDEQLVYYNVDDYLQYAWKNTERTTALEDELIQRARLTICVARHQAEAFRKRHPDRVDHIHHIPHGVAETFLNPAPESPPKPGVVGYVGNLTDRVDWEFTYRVVKLAPELTFEFVGKATDSVEPWAKRRTEVFQEPNVRYLGPVPQAEVPPHYWSSAVNWMPYDTRHPFNIASSPTKIFDAFASGRPFVSTPIPEVECYPERISIVSTPADCAEALRAQASRHDPDTAREMRDFAMHNTWSYRVRHVLELLERAT